VAGGPRAEPELVPVGALPTRGHPWLGLCGEAVDVPASIRALRWSLGPGLALCCGSGGFGFGPGAPGMALGVRRGPVPPVWRAPGSSGVRGRVSISREVLNASRGGGSPGPPRALTGGGVGDPWVPWHRTGVAGAMLVPGLGVPSLLPVPLRGGFPDRCCPARGPATANPPHHFLHFTLDEDCQSWFDESPVNALLVCNVGLCSGAGWKTKTKMKNKTQKESKKGKKKKNQTPTKTSTLLYVPGDLMQLN